MSKAAVFTMKLEPELRDAFMAAAEESHRPASQIVRDMMRDFIRQREEADDYEAFLRKKVSAARGSVANGHGERDETIEADFAARRARAVGHS